MKEEHRKYAEEVYDIINHAAKNIGARLPGSDGEKKFAAYMGDKLREIGIEPFAKSLRFPRVRPSAESPMQAGSVSR